MVFGFLKFNTILIFYYNLKFINFSKMIYNGNRKHSEEQVNEIRNGLKLLKSKKSVNKVVNTSFDNNSSFKRPNKSEEKDIAPPLLRTEWLKLLSDICDNVPMIDVRSENPNTCKDMKCEEIFVVLSQAIFEKMFNSFNNLDEMNVGAFSIKGRTNFLINFI